ncbi:MAG TPA: UvrD-helicase domain-containing protein [Fulvivirga sp.]|nr:UvrD-helicase domain-containing protein [Fulvivirga sp.]
MLQPFVIYRSSAGSGKTHTLARSFLTLALTRRHGFRKILGVTFTNKATEEMKRRIIDILKTLASGNEHPMAKELSDALEINAIELQKRSKEALSDILHQYGRFSIVTIDSFFHQVIRSFTREVGLQGTFSIDLDIDKVLGEVIDQMLLDVGEEEHKVLRSWLTEFAENKVEEGSRWEFKDDIVVLAKEIVKDEFKKHNQQINTLGEDPQFFDTLKKELNEVQFTFEKEIEKKCKVLFDYLSENGLSIDDFKGKGGGPIGLFARMSNQVYEITDRRREAADNIDAWIKKKDPKEIELTQALESFILPKYNELIHYYDTNFIKQQSAIAVKKYFYTFGILSYVSRYLQKYRDENDIMLISDLPDFLNRIISDSDTPYIYEKVGSVFDHYLIDEFQDTSEFQWNNFKPLVKNATDQGQFCMVVGDVKQSIYRFRGGDWRLLQNQVKYDIGEASTIEDSLQMNWRSTANIVGFNNSFFTTIQDTIKGKYLSNIADGLNPEQKTKLQLQVDDILGTFEDVQQELPANKDSNEGEVNIEFIELDKDSEDSWQEEAIRRTIAQVEDLQRKGFELRDIAILTNRAKEGKRVADAFIAYRNSPGADPNLGYDVVSSEALFLTSSHLVRFIISLIKWLNDERNLIELAQWQYEYQHHILQSEKTEAAIFSGIDNWKVNVPLPFLKEKEILKTLPLYELVESISRIFNLNQLKDEFTYLQGFQDAVLDYSKNERGDIVSFLEWWEEVRKERAIQIADENNAIKILTIHKSKGLEFPVVILPFVNWMMDNDTKKNKVMWCPGGDEPPFNKLPIVPLKYVSAMAKTYWADQYFDEKLRALLDNVNLLYVAFTRPIHGLFAYAPLPRIDVKKGISLSTVNGFVYEQLTEKTGWDDEMMRFKSGEIVSYTPKKSATVEYGLQTYHSGDWRKKIQLQIRGSAELNESLFVEATLKGIRLHSLLSRIKYKIDLEQFKLIAEYELLSNIVNHPDIADWFDDKWEVSNEVAVLLPGGAFKRIDRINKKANETVLIDYKTGTSRDKDIAQVKEYIKIMEEMGKENVSGRLIYLEDLSVIEVQSIE